MRQLLVLFLVIFGTVNANSLGMEEQLKDLHAIGKEYMALMNQIGKDPLASYDQRISNLFDTDCKKIVNSSLWYQGSNHYLPQLLAVRDKIGIWRIEPLDIIAGKDDKNVVVRFLVFAENGTVWNTLVILRVNEKGLISEINEVFNNYEGK